MLALLLSSGCLSVDPASCEQGAPAVGEVRVGLVECEDALPSGANGAVGDLLVANSDVYAIVRMDSEAKYFLHVGGGSLVDMGQWGRRESLAEAVPLVGGRWMRSSRVDWGSDELGAWVRLEGVAEPLHFLEADAAEEQSVVYRLGHAGSTLELEGADGLLFLGEEGGELVGEAWEGDDSRFSMEGLARDLGGALRFSGNFLELEGIEELEDEDSEDPISEEEPWIAESEGAVQLAIGVETYPSRRSREPAVQALDRLSTDGAGLVVLAPVDEVGVAPGRGEHHARVLGGSRTEAPGRGSVVVWPVSAKSHKPAHGAASWEGLDALGVLSSAKNAAAGRRAMVDIEWASAAGPMEEWTVVPELIHLQDLDDFHAVRNLWTAGAAIGFAGPTTWVPADTTELPSISAMERGLLLQQSTASSGPVLLAERNASSRPQWDRVRLFSRVLQDHAVDSVEIWSVDERLYESPIPEAVDGLEQTILVPAEQEVWALLRGDDWAVSSVLIPQQSGVIQR